VAYDRHASLRESLPQHRRPGAQARPRGRLLAINFNDPVLFQFGDYFL
jgi:hypothetical protein